MTGVVPDCFGPELGSYTCGLLCLIDLLQCMLLEFSLHLCLSIK
jgi:hypothetical protein